MVCVYSKYQQKTTLNLSGSTVTPTRVMVNLYIRVQNMLMTRRVIIILLHSHYCKYVSTFTIFPKMEVQVTLQFI